VLELVAAHPDLEWFVVDGSTINILDVTTVEMLETLAAELAARGIRLILAGLHPDVRHKLERAGTLERIGTASVFDTLNSATDAFLAQRKP